MWSCKVAALLKLWRKLQKAGLGLVPTFSNMLSHAALLQPTCQQRRVNFSACQHHQDPLPGASKAKLGIHHPAEPLDIWPQILTHIVQRMMEMCKDPSITVITQKNETKVSNWTKTKTSIYLQACFKLAQVILPDLYIIFKNKTVCK